VFCAGNGLKKTAPDRVFRVARLWSNKELRRFSDLLAGDVVNVSAGDDVDKEGGVYAAYFPKATSYTITNYAPGSFRGFQGRENELHLDLSDELPKEYEQRFDVVFNHTTLEHVFDVPLAFRSMCRMSRDLLVLVVPFAQVQHDTEGYKDYWRIAPIALRKMAADNGFTVLYESCNEDDNAGIYIFFIASRQPQQWAGKMPTFQPLTLVGGKIGVTTCMPSAPSWPVRVRQALRYVLHKECPMPEDERVKALYDQP
jgi:hypothetical protein